MTTIDDTPIDDRRADTRERLDDGRSDHTVLASRRRMLRLVGAAAAGATVAAVAGSTRSASASSGDHLSAGNSVSASTGDVTELWGTFRSVCDSSQSDVTVPGANGAIIGWTLSESTGVDAGVLGLAGPYVGTPTTTGNGVVGRVFHANGVGSGVVGLSAAATPGASAALRGRSDAGPALLLDPTFSGKPTSGLWRPGSVVPDTSGRLWYCVQGGTPGTWRNLAAPTFTPITPTRVYDSRTAQPSPGALSTGASRTVSVKDGRDLSGGSITTADVVPAGAVAITCNITVVDTVGAGWLAVNPAGVTTVSAAMVNWSASGQILNNGVNVTIDAATRSVLVIAGGDSGARTDLVIDVTGYHA